MNEEIREIENSLGTSEYVRRVLESASVREGVACRLTNNPHDGVVVIRDDENATAPLVVELTEGEKTQLLIAVGRAYAKLVRL